MFPRVRFTPNPYQRQRLVYGLSYWLRDEFTTDASAPLTSPRAAEPGGGTLTITDTANRLSIASTKLTRVAGFAAAAVWENPRVVADAFSRVAGAALKIQINTGTDILAGWRSSTTGGSASVRYAAFWSNSVTLNFWGTSAEFGLINIVTASTDYSVVLVLRSTGCFLFVKGGTQFTAWSLIWIFGTGAEATLYPSVQYQTAGLVTHDYVRGVTLGAPFDSDNGIATLNVASPAVQDYTATADLIAEITLTAPGTITTEAGLIYRKQDASNYWRAYFNTSGAFRVDSVTAGAATNRVNVAGVITTSATRTIRIVAGGNLHDYYTQSGTTWTKRGTQVSNSSFATQTTIQPDIGSGWTAANQRSYPRVSSAYDVLDTI